GGPVIRNKTFFFFLYEGQRYVLKENFLSSVLTAEARKGNFRFFPGVDNGNAISSNPVVDLQGNVITPRLVNTAIDGGRLQTISVFGRDPLRPGFDPSGFMQKLIARMPLPNDYTIGDGLNAAGYRWVRREAGVDDNTGGS